MAMEVPGHQELVTLMTRASAKVPVRKTYLSILVGIVCSNIPVLVMAGDWQTRYGVNAQEVYSDNNCLDPEDKEGEWVAAVTPSFGVKGTGGRTSLDLSANLELNNLDDDDSRCASGSSDVDSFNPTLRGTGSIELVSNFLFIDASASIRQNSVNPFLAAGDTSINRKGNKNTSYTYGLSPYINHRFKKLAQVNLRYQYDDQVNSADEVDDSSSESASLTLESVPNTSRLSWFLTGEYQNVDADTANQLETTQSEIASINFGLGYQISRKWQVNASSGQDLNDFTTANENEEIDGDRWSAGVRWTPNPRTTVQLGTGNRFIGTTPTLSIDYSHKHSQFSLSYEKVITFSRILRSEDLFFNLENEDGEFLADVNGDLVYVSIPVTTLTSSPILDERLQLGYRWQRGVTGFSVDAVQSEQTRAEDGYSSVFSSVSIGLDRKLSRFLSINGGITFLDTDVAADSQELGSDSQVLRINLGFSRKIGLKTSITGGYNYIDRASEDPSDEYVENRINIGVSMSF